MPVNFDFHSLISQVSIGALYGSIDWATWRETYEGGRLFRDRYLIRFSDRETEADYQRRLDITPIPTYAKREINRVRNALFQRFADILRRGGTKSWQDAVQGNGRGIDNRGTSINTFLGQSILPELLVMSKVGVLVDAPRVAGQTAADVPANYRPYLSLYPVEAIDVVQSDEGSESDWKAVLLRDCHTSREYTSGKTLKATTYRYYYLGDDGIVRVQLLDEKGDPSEPEIITGLTAIPFVLYDIGTSLIQDVCQHQAALLNLMSADTMYAIDANFPFLARQRGNANAGAHLKGEDGSVSAGPTKGVFYEKGLNVPSYVSPPTAPLLASIELRKELKNEVRELVSGAIMDLGQEGTIDSGLAFIGLMLETAEQRLWDHWTAFESIDPAKRKHPIIKYPENWSLRTDEERIEKASALLDLMYKLPGRTVKKEIAKLAGDEILRGRVKTEILDKARAEIDSAEYCTSDPKIIIPAKREGLVSADTGATALGFAPGEAAKAEADQARRAAAIVAAQADQAAARGNADGSVDPGGSPALEREGAAKDAAEEGKPGVRGEGRA